jgi:MFS family permease
LTALTPTLWLLYVMRLMVGFCAGNVATASALIADATDAESRSKGMAVIGISFGIGFTIGAGLGSAISLFEQPGPGFFGSGLPFAVAAGIYLLATVVGAFLLVEPARSASARKQNRVQVGLRAIIHQVRRRPVAIMCTLFLFYTLAVAILEGTFFLYAEATFGWGKFEVGLAFAGLGLLMAVVQGAVGRISKAVGDRPMTMVGVILLSVGLSVAPFTQILWFFLSFLGIATIGRALVHPGVLSLTSSLSEHPSETGKVMGVLQSFGSLARIIGPGLGGLTFQYVAIEAPFWIAGALLLVAGLWWWTMTASQPDNQPDNQPDTKPNSA